MYYEDYFWSSRVDSEHEWQFDADSKKDAYHCAGAYCGVNAYYRAGRSYCGDAIPAAGTPRDCIGWLKTEKYALSRTPRSAARP